jgi:quercetin dioxygenase-like cupin family protein
MPGYDTRGDLQARTKIFPESRDSNKVAAHTQPRSDETMRVQNVNDPKASKIETFPYRGKPLPVKDVWITWLSQAGPQGAPEYGLRFFTIGPGGEIPIHNHLYYQTMYILTGRLACVAYDRKSDQIVEERTLGPHDFVFVPTMEPHSMRNLSDTESVTFLCCIANVYEEDTI